MKKSAALFALYWLASSCASVMNEPNTTVKIITTAPSVIQVDSIYVQTKKNKAKLTIPRSKEALVLKVITDSLEKEVTLPVKNSAAYLSNIIYNYGIGLLVEKNEPKRYTYASTIYLNSADTSSRYFLHPQGNRKGEIHLRFSLPYVNAFQFKPEREGVQTSVGFMGIGAGADFHHSSLQFLTTTFAAAANFPVPFPAPITRDEGLYETMSSSFFSISNNHIIKRFSLGYGLSYGTNRWTLSYRGGSEEQPPKDFFTSKRNTFIGLILPAYHQASEHFYLGLLYRPSFLGLNSTPFFQYEHLISLDLAWKFRIKRQAGESTKK